MFTFTLDISKNEMGILYMYPSGNGFFLEPVLEYNAGSDGNPSWRRISDFTLVPVVLMKKVGNYSESGEMVEVHHSREFIEYVLRRDGWETVR